MASRRERRSGRAAAPLLPFCGRADRSVDDSRLWPPGNASRRRRDDVHVARAKARDAGRQVGAGSS
eukprot:scaffold1911_cov397-Prasinococcus_capsulatus_cf.AAC.18